MDGTFGAPCCSAYGFSGSLRFTTRLLSTSIAGSVSCLRFLFFFYASCPRPSTFRQATIDHCHERLLSEDGKAILGEILSGHQPLIFSVDHCDLLVGRI